MRETQSLLTRFIVTSYFMYIQLYTVAKYKVYIVVYIKRNSGLFDESMLDVSLHQTEVIFVANNDRHVADDHGRSRSVKTFSLFLSQEVIC